MNGLVVIIVGNWLYKTTLLQITWLHGCKTALLLADAVTTNIFIPFGTSSTTTSGHPISIVQYSKVMTSTKR